MTDDTLQFFLGLPLFLFSFFFFFSFFFLMGADLFVVFD